MAKLFLSIWLFRMAAAFAVYLSLRIVGHNNMFYQLCHFLRGPDAFVYHERARELAKHLGSMESYTKLIASQPWEAILATLYSIFTPHPIVAALFGQTCLAMAGMLAFSAARAAGQAKAVAIFIALIIGLWPPSFAYTLVPLRDGPVLLGMFLFLCGIIKLNTPSGRFNFRSACWSLGVVAGFLLVAALRTYLWPLLLTVGSISLLWPVLVRFMKRRELGLISNIVFIAVLLAVGALAASYWQGKMLPVGTVKVAESGKPAGASTVTLVNPFQRAFYSLMLRREGFIMTGGNSLSPDAKELRRYLGFPDDNQVLKRRQWKAAILQNTDKEPGRPRYAVLGKFRYIFWHEPLDLVRLLPNSLAHLWLYPLPWQTWSNSLSQPVRLFLLAQELLWLGLLPGILLGLMNFRAGALHRVNLNLWVWGLGILLALVVVNLGTLYRLRDMVLLPAIIVFLPTPYIKFGESIKRFMNPG
jgi:hypothetical protein